MVLGCHEGSARTSATMTSPAVQGAWDHTTRMTSHSVSEILGTVFIARWFDYIRNLLKDYSSNPSMSSDFSSRNRLPACHWGAKCPSGRRADGVGQTALARDCDGWRASGDVLSGKPGKNAKD